MGYCFINVCIIVNRINGVLGFRFVKCLRVCFNVKYVVIGGKLLGILL